MSNVEIRGVSPLSGRKRKGENEEPMTWLLCRQSLHAQSRGVVDHEGYRVVECGLCRF